MDLVDNATIILPAALEQLGQIRFDIYNLTHIRLHYVQHEAQWDPKLKKFVIKIFLTEKDSFIRPVTPA